MSEIADLLAAAARMLPDTAAFAPVWRLGRSAAIAESSSVGASPPPPGPLPQGEGEKRAPLPVADTMGQAAVAPSAVTGEERGEAVGAERASFAVFAPQAQQLATQNSVDWMGSSPPELASEKPGGTSSARVAPSPGTASAADVAWQSRPAAPSAWETSQPAAADSAAPSRAMAPPAQLPETGAATGGDVFLDGARMGHWVAGQLAREAGRPQRGGTGFDPRLGARWPGSLQGS
jgi:hypothetical protein